MRLSIRLRAAAGGPVGSRANRAGERFGLVQRPMRCIQHAAEEAGSDWVSLLCYTISKIGFIGLRDRIEALVEMVPVVLRANHFVKRYLYAALVASIALNRVPGHREGTGVLDADGDFDPFAAID
jgi:hypothetical protein